MDANVSTKSVTASWIPPPLTEFERETLNGEGGYPVTNAAYTKCFVCKAELIDDKGWEWLDGQTKLITLFCQRCQEYTVAKQFITISFISEGHVQGTAGTIVPAVHKYFTALSNVKYMDMRCTTQGCNKFHTFATINQSTYLNTEVVTCAFCKQVVRFSQQSQCIKRAIIKGSRASNPPATSTSKNPTIVASVNRFSVLTQEENIDGVRESSIRIDTPPNESASSRSESDNLRKRAHVGPPGVSPVYKRQAATPQSHNLDSPGVGDACTRDATAPRPRRVDAPGPSCDSARREAVPRSRTMGSSESNNRSRSATKRCQASDKQISVPRSQRLPPIIATIPGVNNDDAILRNITKAVAEHKCTLTADKRSPTIRITPTTLEGRQKILTVLTNIAGAEYYTFGTPQERRPSKKIVAKGFVMGDFSEEEVRTNIRETWGLNLEKVVQLNNSAVVLIFGGDTDMRDIKAINTLMYQRIKVEAYRVKPTAVTQCKQCLEFGHVKTHCGRKPVPAYYTDSDMDGNQSTDPAQQCCTKCRIPGHTAFQAKCPYFQEEIKKQRERRRQFKAQRDRVAAAKPEKKQSPPAHHSVQRLVTAQISYANATLQKKQEEQAFMPLASASQQALGAQPAYATYEQMARILASLERLESRMDVLETRMDALETARQTPVPPTIRLNNNVRRP